MSLQKNIKLLTWFNFFTDFKLYGAFIIIYFSTITHSYALGASILSITFITASLLDIPTGIFADRLGRKRTVILGAVFGVAYAMFYAVGGSYWILVVGALLEGLSRALYSGNNSALLHNLLSDEGLQNDYHVYAGKLGSMFQIGLAVSALVGGFIASWSFPILMWLSVIPQLVCLFLSFQIIDSKKVYEHTESILQHLKEGFLEFIQNANLRLLSITSILSYGMGETFYQFSFPFANTLLPLWAVGMTGTTSSMLAALGYRFSGKIINKLGGIKTLLLGEIIKKIFSFVALLFPTVASPFILASDSFFYGTGEVASDSLMQKEFTDKQRATMSSLNTFAGGLFYGCFAFIVGLLIDTFGIRNILLIIQILLLPTVWFVFKLLKTNRKSI